MAEENSEAKLRQLEERNRRLRAAVTSDRITKVLITLIKWGALIWIAYYVATTFQAFAGKASIADVNLSGKLGLEVENDVRECPLPLWVWLVVALNTIVTVLSVGIALGRTELQRRTVSHLSDSKTQLERIIDPGRKGSGLTKTGETPEDEHD